MTRATFGFELFYLENCKVYSNKNHIYSYLERIKRIFLKFISCCNYDKCGADSRGFQGCPMLRKKSELMEI